MSLSDKGLISDHPHLFEGRQRIYDIGNGYSISMISSKVAHYYPFAWEAAVIKDDKGLVYDTPLTDDVEVFQSDEEANAFLEKAFKWSESLAGG